jgi:nucleoside-diphosphate-sugar epimerase
MNDYEGVRAAVLGAAGFLGRWVARKLCQASAWPYLIVRDAAAARGVFDQYEIRGQVIQTDLSDEASVGDVYSRIRPSITFNLAGYGVDPSERDEELARSINAGLPSAICGAAARVKDAAWPGQHVIHVGSAAEYGDAGRDLREDGPANPTTAYGKSKLEGTRAVVERCAALGLRGMVARVFTVYGPGEHSGRLLPSLIEAKRTGKALDLTSGVQRRDFTYVEDVAEGLLRLGLVSSGGGGIVNLATGQLTSVRGFAESAAGILDIPWGHLRFGKIPARDGEMEHDPISLERMRHLVEWTPPVTIAQGIRKTMEISLLKRTAPLAYGH